MDACERGASCFKVLLSKKNFDCFCVDAILNKREITEKAWSTWQPKMTPFWNIIKARLCRVTLSCFGKRIPSTKHPYLFNQPDKHSFNNQFLLACFIFVLLINVTVFLMQYFQYLNQL